MHKDDTSDANGGDKTAGCMAYAQTQHVSQRDRESCIRDADHVIWRKKREREREQDGSMPDKRTCPRNEEGKERVHVLAIIRAHQERCVSR